MHVEVSRVWLFVSCLWCVCVLKSRFQERVGWVVDSSFERHNNWGMWVRYGQCRLRTWSIGVGIKCLFLGGRKEEGSEADQPKEYRNKVASES